MKHQQYAENGSSLIMKRHKITDIQQGLSNLKANVAAMWIAFGNLLLFMGGDDSVEIGFHPCSMEMLSPSAIPLTGDSNKEQCS